MKSTDVFVLLIVQRIIIKKHLNIINCTLFIGIVYVVWIGVGVVGMVLIGYVVKPFYIEVEKKENHIVQFEKLIKANYSDYYDRFYRTYWFSKNSSSDTLILVAMLSTKQLSSIPNWQCEEQEADTYNLLYKNKSNNKHPRFFTYNCTKGRFKILGDPD